MQKEGKYLLQIMSAERIFKVFFLAGAANIEFEELVDGIFDFTGVGIGDFFQEFIDFISKFTVFVEIDEFFRGIDGGENFNANDIMPAAGVYPAPADAAEDGFFQRIHR